MVVDGSRLFRLDLGQLGKELLEAVDMLEAVDLLNRGLIHVGFVFFFLLPPHHRYVCIPYKDPKCCSASKYANTI